MARGERQKARHRHVFTHVSEFLDCLRIGLPGKIRLESYIRGTRHRQASDKICIGDCVQDHPFYVCFLSPFKGKKKIPLPLPLPSMWDWFYSHLCVLHLRSCSTKQDLEKFVDRWCNVTWRCCSSSRCPSSMVDLWLKRPSRLCAVDLLYACEQYTLLDVLVQQYNSHALCEQCHDELPDPDRARILDAPHQVWQAWANQHRPRLFVELNAYIIPDLAHLVGDYVCGVSLPSPHAPSVIYKIPFTNRIAGPITRHVVENGDASITICSEANKLYVSVIRHGERQNIKARWIEPHTVPTRWMRTAIIQHRPFSDGLVLQIVAWKQPEFVVRVYDVVLVALLLACALTFSVFTFYYVYWSMWSACRYCCNVFTTLSPYWALPAIALAIHAKRGLPWLLFYICLAVALPLLFVTVMMNAILVMVAPLCSR
jgi:hypothetical protein